MTISLTIKKSYLPAKKYTAYFKDSKTGKTKKTHFGAKNYRDFTTVKDTKVRANYRARHQHDIINDPYRPGSLSWYILWGNSTSITENINTFKKKFGFK